MDAAPNIDKLVIPPFGAGLKQVPMSDMIVGKFYYDGTSNVPLVVEVVKKDIKFLTLKIIYLHISRGAQPVWIEALPDQELIKQSFQQESKFYVPEEDIPAGGKRRKTRRRKNKRKTKKRIF